MKSTFFKIWNTVTNLIVALAILLAIALVGVRLVGLQVYTVLSGSMEPAYHTGSLIYVKSVPYTELESGDVITFMLDEDTVATHRIVEVVPDEEDAEVLRYRTKGDANESEDGSLVHYKNIIGTPVFTIPGLGYFANFIQNPPGTYIAISVGAILILMIFLPDLLTDDDGETPAKQKKKKKQKKAAPAAVPAKTGTPKPATTATKPATTVTKTASGATRPATTATQPGTKPAARPARPATTATTGTRPATGTSPTKTTATRPTGTSPAKTTAATTAAPVRKATTARPGTTPASPAKPGQTAARPTGTSAKPRAAQTAGNVEKPRTVQRPAAGQSKAGETPRPNTEDSRKALK